MCRNKFSPNEITVYDDYAEIILYDVKNRERARTKIDLAVIDDVRQYKWHIHQKYVATSFTKGGPPPILLHRFIMKPKPGEEVDHINGDRLDNRKCNLRICTKQQNRFNTNPFKKNSSGRAGVVWDTAHQRWVAQIQVNRKKYYLGYYRNIEDAIAARVEGEKKYFKDFAPTERRL